MAVFIGVGGIIVYYFQIITPITIVANLLVVPLLTVLLILGAGLLCFGAWPAVSLAFGVSLKAVLNFLVWLVYLMAHIPGAYFYSKDVTIWHIISYYIFVFGLWRVLAKFLPKFQEDKSRVL